MTQPNILEGWRPAKAASQLVSHLFASNDGTTRLPDSNGIMLQYSDDLFVEPSFTAEAPEEIFWATLDGSSYFLVYGREVAEVSA